jgi:hypothetical protein
MYLYLLNIIYTVAQIQEFGACPRRLCNNGYYPIHEAAKNASSRTMEVFLQWGESRGCTREEMISFHDSEGNVPLHSAVHGGDIKVNDCVLKKNCQSSTFSIVTLILMVWDCFAKNYWTLDRGLL